MSDNKVVGIAVKAERIEMENERLRQFLARDRELLQASIAAIASLKAQTNRYHAALVQIASGQDKEGYDLNRGDMMRLALTTLGLPMESPINDAAPL